MKITYIDDRFATGAQIGPEEVGQLAKAGFGVIICARPDGEDKGQPDAALIARAAAEYGIAFLHVPMRGRVVPEEAISAICSAWSDSSAPIFAYCRSGARAAALHDLVRGS